MAATRYISEYRHTDGTRWRGPDYYADSIDEARARAAEYPVQPIVILGAHAETVDDGDDVHIWTYLPPERTH